MSAKRILVLVIGLVIVAGILPPAIYWFLIGRAPSVSAEEARRRLETGQSVLVDVRSEKEFAAGHLAGAVHWPCEKIREAATLPEELKGRELLVICASGWRSAPATLDLQRQGVTRVHSVRGGLQAWAIDTPRPCPAAFVLHSPGAAPATQPAASFRPASMAEQWVAVITAFGVKPVYMALALVLAWILRGKRKPDAVAMRWAMICFFLGEAFCAANYAIFKERSYLFEYLHSFGMVLAFALAVFSALEFVDLRIIHYSAPDQRCALLGICHRCIKGTDAPCGLRRAFFLLIPAAIAVALIPLCAPIRLTVYTTQILGSPYTYVHETVHQVYEVRFLPLLAIVLLGASLVVLWARERHPTPISRVLFSAALGALGFSLFRMVLLGTFSEHQVWFASWEEFTELLAVVAAAVGLLIFRTRHPIVAGATG